MPAWILPAALFAFIVLNVIVSIRRERTNARLLSARMIVLERRAYPNNHHVLGVGYYHATHGRWHSSPWNEFRDGEGYYWDGQWHEVPDDRQVACSVPDPKEIMRVNEAWRRAGPLQVSDFWADVDRFGFGTAIGRRQGS